VVTQFIHITCSPVAFTATTTTITITTTR